MPFILFFTMIISMLACHFIAKSKGRNPIAWGVTGALLGPLGILIVLLAPKANSDAFKQRNNL